MLALPPDGTKYEENSTLPPDTFVMVNLSITVLQLLAVYCEVVVVSQNFRGMMLSGDEEAIAHLNGNVVGHGHYDRGNGRNRGNRASGNDLTPSVVG